MKNFIPGIFAIVLAIAFTTFSAFSHRNVSDKKFDPMVRFIQNSAWSTADQTLTDAETSSDCPDGTTTICAEFYEVSHLFINPSGQVTGIRIDPGTSLPYLPDLTLKYTE